MSNVSESILQGLTEAVQWSQGKLSCRTQTLQIEPVKGYDAAEVKKIRTNLNMTQSSFAQCMGVSKKTVEAWESGKNTPAGAASRLLSLVEKDPQILQNFCHVSSQPHIGN